MGKHLVRHVAAKTAVVVLVCQKCSKKLGGGFGADGNKRLAKLLRAAVVPLGSKPEKKPRRAAVDVIEVDCLKLCPKGAVVALRGDRPGDWLVVPSGTPIDTIAADLGLTPFQG